MYRLLPARCKCFLNPIWMCFPSLSNGLPQLRVYLVAVQLPFQHEKMLLEQALLFPSTSYSNLRVSRTTSLTSKIVEDKGFPTKMIKKLPCNIIFATNNHLTRDRHSLFLNSRVSPEAKLCSYNVYSYYIHLAARFPLHLIAFQNMYTLHFYVRIRVSNQSLVSCVWRHVWLKPTHNFTCTHTVFPIELKALPSIERIIRCVARTPNLSNVCT